MKVLSGNIRLPSKKLLILLGIVLCCVCLCIIYRSYLSGSIELDSTFLNDEKLMLIYTNWEKLIESDFFKDWTPDDGHTHVIQYTKNRNESSQFADTIFYIVVKDTEQATAADYEDWYWEARYDRKGLVNMLYGLGHFGECTSRFFVQNRFCAIQGTFYESSGTAREFYDVMSIALEIVSK